MATAELSWPFSKLFSYGHALHFTFCVYHIAADRVVRTPADGWSICRLRLSGLQAPAGMWIALAGMLSVKPRVRNY